MPPPVEGSTEAPATAPATGTEDVVYVQGADLGHADTVTQVIDFLHSGVLLPEHEALVAQLPDMQEPLKTAVVQMLILRYAEPNPDGSASMGDLNFSVSFMEGLGASLATTLQSGNGDVNGPLALLLPLLIPADSNPNHAHLETMKVLGDLIELIPDEVLINDFGFSAQEVLTFRQSLTGLTLGGLTEDDHIKALTSVVNFVYKALTGEDIPAMPVDEMGRYKPEDAAHMDPPLSTLLHLSYGIETYKAFNEGAGTDAFWEAASPSNSQGIPHHVIYNMTYHFGGVMGSIVAGFETREQTGIIVDKNVDFNESTMDFILDHTGVVASGDMTAEELEFYKDMIFIFNTVNSVDGAGLTDAQVRQLEAARFLISSGYVDQGLKLMSDVALSISDQIVALKSENPALGVTESYTSSIELDQALFFELDSVINYVQDNQPGIEAFDRATLTPEQQEAFDAVIYAYYGDSANPSDYNPGTFFQNLNHTSLTPEAEEAVAAFYLAMGQAAPDPSAATGAGGEGEGEGEGATEEPTTTTRADAASVASLGPPSSASSGDPRIGANGERVEYPPPIEFPPPRGTEPTDVTAASEPYYAVINQAGTVPIEDLSPANIQALAYAQQLRRDGNGDAALMVEASVAIDLMSRSIEVHGDAAKNFTVSSEFPSEDGTVQPFFAMGGESLTIPQAIFEAGTVQFAIMIRDNPEQVTFVTQVLASMGSSGPLKHQMDKIQPMLDAHLYYSSVGNTEMADMVLLEIEMIALDALNTEIGSIEVLPPEALGLAYVFETTMNNVFTTRVGDLIQKHGVFFAIKLKSRLVVMLQSVLQGEGEAAAQLHLLRMKVVDEALNIYRQSLQAALSQ